MLRGSSGVGPNQTDSGASVTFANSGSNVTFVAFRIEGHIRVNPDRTSRSSSVTFAYLQKVLVDGEAIAAVVQAVFSQIIFDILAGWWPADG